MSLDVLLTITATLDRIASRRLHAWNGMLLAQKLRRESGLHG
jgi:hypothetical protein